MQLFNNLLENGLRYTTTAAAACIFPPNNATKSLFLTFADSAPGVSDEQLQSDPFLPHGSVP